MEIAKNLTLNIVADVVRQGQVSAPTPVTTQAVPVAPRRAEPEKGRAPDKVQEKTSPEELRKLVDQSIKEMNVHLDLGNHSIQFSVDDSSKELVVKVVDTNTDKVIRQIPAEDLLRLRAHMKELSGMIVEEKV
jgi:flagellar protein FlaG